MPVSRNNRGLEGRACGDIVQRESEALAIEEEVRYELADKVDRHRAADEHDLVYLCLVDLRVMEDPVDGLTYGAE